MALILLDSMPRGRDNVTDDAPPAPTGNSLLARFAVAFFTRSFGRLEPLAQLCFKLPSHLRVITQVPAGVVLALADTFVAVSLPGAPIPTELGLHAHLAPPPLT
mgnify:CR=1 FL=1